MSVQQGDRAPAFTLPNKPGETVDLGRHIGREKVVLLFFPFAFSPVCTEEMCYFRDSWQDWESLGVRVFGISVDGPIVVEKFRQDAQIPFPLLSDFNRDIAAQYGVLHEEIYGLRGVARRAVFVIDETGKVIYRWVADEPANQVPFDKVRRAVAGEGAPAA